jgi:hypothetical protein
MVLKLAEAVAHDVAMSLRKTGRVSKEMAIAFLPNASNWGYGLITALSVALAETWVIFLTAGRPMDVRVDSIEWIGRAAGPSSSTRGSPRSPLPDVPRGESARPTGTA